MKFDRGIVYTAHNHKTQNRCCDIVKFVLALYHIPINPFLTIPPPILNSFGLTKFERLALDMRLLAKCDEIWTFGEITYGVGKEIEWWKNYKPTLIRYISWEELDQCD